MVYNRSFEKNISNPIFEKGGTSLIGSMILFENVVGKVSYTKT